MLRLYDRHPTSALDIRLVEPVPTQEWEALRRNAARLMKGRLCPHGSIVHLQDSPYELWKGTNEYGDNFELLHFKANLELYTELERQNENEEFLHSYAYPDIADALEKLDRPIRFIAISLDLSEDVRSVSPPEKLEITSAIVDAALADAEMLIRSSGPSNALDRVHTALHGYLKAICAHEDIAVDEDANITALFARIREEHPAFVIADRQSQRMTIQILRGLAQIIEALNPVRNDRSMAHPNALLDEAEAMLAINSIRTLLHYFDKKLK